MSPCGENRHQKEKEFFSIGKVVCAGLEIKFTLPSSDKRHGDNLWKMEVQLYIVFCSVFSFFPC